MATGTNIDIHTAPIEVGVGSELGSYELVSLLGEGAMGRVFKGRHVKLGRSVAIKVLNPEYAARPDIVKRFFREARVVNEISHEHIVEVTDFVEVPGLAFLVMELLDGESLRDLLKRRKGKWPPVRRIVSVMAQVCDALAAAHDKGVVHRDLKPDNVFVIKRAGGDYAKVLDFGIAKLKDQSEGGGPGSTITGMILGTPLYMSPEQATGKEVGPASDVWAAGVVLYELLSGGVPFKAGNFVDLVQKIRNQPAPPLPLRTPRRERIPAALGAAVMKCLEKSPSDRHRSMDALAEALRSAMGISGRRWRAPWKGLAAAAALVAAGYAAWRSDLLRKAKPIAGRVGTEVSEATRAAQSAVSSAVRATPEPPRPRPSPSREAEARERREAEAREKREAEQAKETRREAARAKQARASHATTVELDVRSSPPGARVVRLDTGELLGRTPIKLRFYQKHHEVALRFTLDGYEPAKTTASLKSSGRVSVTLRKSRRRH